MVKSNSRVQFSLLMSASIKSHDTLFQIAHTHHCILITFLHYFRTIYTFSNLWETISRFHFTPKQKFATFLLKIWLPTQIEFNHWNVSHTPLTLASSAKWKKTSKLYFIYNVHYLDQDLLSPTMRVCVMAVACQQWLIFLSTYLQTRVSHLPKATSASYTCSSEL